MVSCSTTHGRIRAGEVQSLGFGEQPVEADDLQAMSSRMTAELFAVSSAERRWVGPQREGGRFDSRVARLGNQPTLLRPRCEFVEFLTNGKFH